VSRIPSINSLVEVVFDDTRTYRSRMEDVADDVLTVAAPIGAGDVEPPALGEVFVLAWADHRARHMVSVRLTAMTTERPIRWQVQVDGEPRRDNRRNFMRAGGGGEAVQIQRSGRDDAAAAKGAAAAEDAAAAGGRLIDISEAAIRCWLGSCEYQPGELVAVATTLHNHQLELVGTVLSVRQPAPAGKGAEIVVTYEVDEARAQIIRRYVMDYDLVERRRERDQAA